MSSGEEILPQHLNLPAGSPLQAIERQLALLSGAEQELLRQRLAV